MTRAAVRKPAGRPPLVWAQSRSGWPIDLLDPRPEAVDFAEIAETLAHIARFNGATSKPLSVAHHTLIACDAAPAELRPWVLLHDAHEARLGDMTTPVVAALDLVFKVMAPSDLTSPVPSEVVQRLKHQHDRAIHAAAGLPMPTDAQRLAIADADRRALVTERRDFCADPPPDAPRWSWGEVIENTPPLTKRYRMRAALDVADELMGMFAALLPALRGR